MARLRRALSQVDEDHPGAALRMVNIPVGKLHQKPDALSGRRFHEFQISRRCQMLIEDDTAAAWLAVMLCELGGE